jgi:hypothetical protein
VNLVSLLALISVFISAEHLNAYPDRESPPVESKAYGDIEEECYHFIYSVYRNLHIWEWPDSMIKHILKTNLEDYLIGYLNTPESRKLHQKYEAVDWNIHEMMEMHLSVDE